MGYKYEFNWILKLSDIDSDILVGQNYHFVKHGVRVYPIGIPIDLVNSKWEAVARCVINKITISSEQTDGYYSIIEIYSQEKRQVLSEQWSSLLKIAKGVDEIEAFEQIHIT